METALSSHEAKRPLDNTSSDNIALVENDAGYNEC
jgi:hypothetical protein